jgi:IPT/TIG domain
VALPSGPAFAATKAPQITKVSPTRVKVGSRLTIRGKNFNPRRTRNTVFFRGAGGTSAFVKPSKASRTKLVVKVPKSVGKLLKRKSGKAQSTRIKIRVLTSRFSKYTSSRLSPVVTGTGVPDIGAPAPRQNGSTGGTGSGGGSNAVAPTCPAGDPDGDLLDTATENSIGTNPCNRDSDGDGVTDGYEYQSALDLTHYPSTPPAPYPGKKPYPNALDPNDAGTDYDGDGMALGEEYLMWARFSSDGVRRTGAPTTLSNLLYSDGLQRSQSVSAPAAGTLDAWSLDLNDDGTLIDGERDADGDKLSNWDEGHGQMVEAWWAAEHAGAPAEPKESPYPGINFLDNAEVGDAFADGDIDGNGIADGQDDFDHDGLTNEFELRRPDDWDAQAWVVNGSGGFDPGPNSWAYTNPFNPCKPYRSERCHQHPPFGYYAGDERPPIGPNPPAGYPDTHPTTPNG